MATRCKFRCDGMEKIWDGFEKRFIYSYRFQAVTSGSEENKKFFAWTPSGELKVTSVTVDSFEPGKEYYLDITEVMPEPESVPTADPQK